MDIKFVDLSGNDVVEKAIEKSAAMAEIMIPGGTDTDELAVMSMLSGFVALQLLMDASKQGAKSNIMSKKTWKCAKSIFKKMRKAVHS